MGVTTAADLSYSARAVCKLKFPEVFSAGVGTHGWGHSEVEIQLREVLQGCHTGTCIPSRHFAFSEAARSWSLSARHVRCCFRVCCSCAAAGAGEVIEATRVPCRSGAALHIRRVTSIRPGQGRCLRSALKEGILIVQLPEGSSLMKLHDLITPNHAPSFLDVIPKKKRIAVHS